MINFKSVLGLVAKETFNPSLAFSNAFDFPLGFVDKEPRNTSTRMNIKRHILWDQNDYGVIHKNTTRCLLILDSRTLITNIRWN